MPGTCSVAKQARAPVEAESSGGGDVLIRLSYLSLHIQKGQRRWHGDEKQSSREQGECWLWIKAMPHRR